MKKVTRILTAVSIIGLFVSIVLADGLCPTAKELIAAVVIFIMSTTTLIAALYLKETFIINKK